MPSSRPNHIPTVIGIMLKLSPQSILDIGVGFGKWGFLLREYTDIRLSEKDPARYQRENWKVRIDGIEGYQPYVTPVHRYIYSEVMIGDAREVIERVGRYDMILIADVIEHLPKTDGVRLLQRCREHCDGAVIVTTPGSFVAQGAACGNELERHRSEWRREDFENFPGAKARIVENDILVAVIPAPGITAPDIAAPLRSPSQTVVAADNRRQAGQSLLRRALAKARRLILRATIA